MTALAIVACKDECNHVINPDPVLTPDVVGTWYEEEVNEETRFSESGTYYDKYCNTTRAYETEGRYEVSADGRKLTCTYNFMGQTQFQDWTITNLDELALTITASNAGTHILEKVVEAYNLNVGQTQQIEFSSNYPSYRVQSYTAQNERIASVTADGLITANGEKGTTYIKIATDNGNAWVKVVVGDEYLDLWYDYVSLIGMNYTQLRATLGNPHQNDGDQGFFYATEYHDVLKQVSVWLNPRTRTVEVINLIVRDGVPHETVLSYLEARYYKNSQIGKVTRFTNFSTVESSQAIIEYDPDVRTVVIVDAESQNNLWPDFTSVFGADAAAIRQAADAQQMTFSFNDKSYSPYGSDYYTDEYGEYVNIFGFVFNESGQMFEYWAYLKDGLDLVAVASIIGENYVYEESESGGGRIVWYNAEKTLRVELNAAYNCIIYRDLTLQGLPDQKWPDYTSAFGMTLEQIVSTYGDLYYGVLPMYYLSNDYVEYVYFNVDDNSGKTTAYMLKLNEGYSVDEIREYLSSIYTFYKANDTNTMFAYCDGPTRDESKLQVVFNTENGTITYYDIAAFSQSSSSAPKRVGNKVIPTIGTPVL